MSNITGEGDRDWIGLCLNTDARESRCRKIHLCNLGWKKIQRWGRRKEGAKRRGAGRLSNYPFKPNLRCCLKLTYANEVAKSHWGSQWLRLYRSKIGFHILSQYYQMQILNCGKMFMYWGTIFHAVWGRRTACCDISFHLCLKCKRIFRKAVQTHQTAWGLADRIKQRLW